jgi:hypothetical protein
MEQQQLVPASIPWTTAQERQSVITLRVPKSVHAALVRQASELSKMTGETVSMNRLVASKALLPIGPDGLVEFTGQWKSTQTRVASLEEQVRRLQLELTKRS